jgi:hypothetical protein
MFPPAWTNGIYRRIGGSNGQVGFDLRALGLYTISVLLSAIRKPAAVSVRQISA